MRKILFVCFVSFSLSGADLVSAIHKVETGGKTGKILGDGGKALGPLQIHQVNWRDAIEFDKSIGGKYSDCEKLEYSKKIFNAYLTRYAKNKTNEQKARIWNGGPNGAKNKNTLKYWQKVKMFLK
jgi:hypothetical protein